MRRQDATATAFLVLSLLIAPVLAAPAPASALLASQNCGPSIVLSHCIANNYVHTVYPWALTTNIRNDLQWMHTQHFNNSTDLVTAMDADMDADVIARDNDYGPSPVYYAATLCPSTSQKYGTNPNVVCRPQELRFNLYWPGAFATQFDRRAIACHELGHTLGLHHRNHLNSCMNEPVFSDILEVIDIQEINAKYYPY